MKEYFLSSMIKNGYRFDMILTAPLARYVAKNFQELPKPYKRYQLGTVWRNEKPGPGRFREFIQFDADFVGTRNLQADAELCIMISDILEACGLSKNDYIIKISSRKFIEKIFSKLKILDENQKSIVLRALDKIDRLGWVEVKKLLSETPGCKLVDEHVDGGYITPIEAQDDFKTYISRVRKDRSNEKAINMWIVSDNLLKGAALNSVQIAETLVKYGIK